MRGKIFENPKAKKPKWFGSTGGKCFYCGRPMFNLGAPQLRDWLFLSVRQEAVKEHRIPAIRGGGNERENLVPACAGCNADKGAFTDAEFRFVRALAAGSLNFRFPFEPAPLAQRDWIIVHSASFERNLIIHNVPSAAEAYRLRNGWARGPRGQERQRQQ